MEGWEGSWPGQAASALLSMGWAPWRAAQGFTCWPRMFLPASLQWLSWEKKALPDLDFSWAPEVLPLIGRLIFNLSHLCLQGKKVSQRVVVPAGP